MRKSTQARWVRPAKLLWLPAVAAVVAFLVAFGTHHLLWTYQYTGRADAKYFVSCNYIGRDAQTIVPLDGKCPIVAMLKPTGRE